MTVSLFSAPRAANRVRVLTRIPAGVDGGGGLSLWIFSGWLNGRLDYASLLTGTTADASDLTIAIQSGVTSQYEKRSLSSLPFASTTDLAGKQSLSETGVANGYAALDSDGDVPASQLDKILAVLCALPTNLNDAQKAALALGAWFIDGGFLVRKDP